MAPQAFETKEEKRGRRRGSREATLNWGRKPLTSLGGGAKMAQDPDSRRSTPVNRECKNANARGMPDALQSARRRASRLSENWHPKRGRRSLASRGRERVWISRIAYVNGRYLPC